MTEFFVYDLIDQRDGGVFYVGKGKGNRPFHHEREALAGKRSRKCDRIRAILADGMNVGIVIGERFADEAAAYKAEEARIALIGLSTLTNVLPGGGGAPSRVSRPKRQKLTKKWAEIMARALQLMHGGKRLMLGPYDVTAIFHGLVSRFIEDHGEEKVCAALLPFGVKLEVKYGQAASL